ncbi:DegT/DnrJ/EryC1/StrS family aminotransferase [Algoriphagus namhaensis]|uniref:DegT/DnrJ/EryC1/StrS family aminotransferase n=1 Tax=Algoriphagus namhaensis TaxID=915353 RepID=A0ABV8ARV8_9BACT
MKVPFLDLSKMDDSLKEELQKAFKSSLDSGIFSGGKEVQSFIENLKKQLGEGYLQPLGNGTDALELALRALDIQPEDEVIVPSLTWVSTAEVVHLLGAKPIFCDTDNQGLISTNWVDLVTPKTRAIMPVHLYGKMVDMAPMCGTASKLGLAVVEDAAQSFGASQGGKASGTWGDVGAFSFYPTKNLGALGEAGACFTKSQDLAERISLFSNHGQIRRDEHLSWGRNARIDTIQASFLNVFLARFESFQKRRKTLAKNYLEALEGYEGLLLPGGVLEEDHNAHLFVIQTTRRDELKEYLHLQGIGTAIHYPKILPDLISFQAKGDFSISRKITETCLSLPLNPNMSDSDQAYVIEKIQAFFK